LFIPVLHKDVTNPTIFLFGCFPGVFFFCGFYGPDALLATQPLKVLKETQSTDPNQEESPTGFILSSVITGFLRHCSLYGSSAIPVMQYLLLYYTLL